MDDSPYPIPDFVDDVDQYVDEWRRQKAELCDCYKCEGEQLGPNGRTIMNNMEYHTYRKECPDCGAERTKYRDLGRKGRFVCTNCR